MKVTCCCFTCIIGQEKDEEKEENSRLLHSESGSEPSALPKQSSYSRSTSALSSSSTNRALSTESGEPPPESVDGKPVSKDKFTKAVGVLKKYNVMSSKYNTKELQRQMSLPARLRIKVGFKVMPRSSTVKVSVIEAHDVMSALQSKGLPDAVASSDQEQQLVVQVRTKILHSEVRGHTKKYEIQGSITGALKLRSETIHSIDLEEFLRCKIRFRFYCVMKHSRDKLLGEYTLDVETLNFDKNNPVPNVMLDLYDSAIADFESSSSKSPGLVPSKAASYESQTSTEKDSQSSSTPKIQRQAKIRSQDSELRASLKKDAEKATESSHSAEKSEEESSIKKAFRSIRGSTSSKDQSFEGLESSVAQTTGEFDRLKMAVKERTEKVEELEESTAEMADSAKNLSLLSIKLKEKYMAKSKSSDS